MYWLFNNDYFKVTGKEKEIFSWQQRLNFKGEQNDQIIVYKFDSKRGLFIYLYKIVEIEINPLQKEENILSDLRVTVTAELLKDFNEEKEIEDYIYSFPRIIYFSNYKYKHFNRRYYRLTEVEFDAIVDNNIFEARSIIGTALNSMHIEHREAFVRELIEEMPGILQNKYRHDRVLGVLKNYLGYAVIAPAKQLTEAFYAIEGVIEENARQAMGFADEAGITDIDTISRQVNIINESIDEMESSLVLNDNFYQLNRKFEKIFTNRPLPIDLTA